jgi:hypothetical protein
MKLLLLYCSIMLFACNSNPNQAKENQVPLPKPAQTRPQLLSDLLLKWNDYHAIDKVDSLQFLYAEKVSFYGQFDLNKEVCVQKTKAIIVGSPDFQQRIDSIRWRFGIKDSSKVYCFFLKTVFQKNKPVTYQAYLNFEWNSTLQQYQISNEGDDTTDENLEKQAVESDQIYEKGDYNGDSIPEKMWLRLESPTPELNSWSTIRFSDKKIPVLFVENCIWGVPRNEGDLDGDGADEISLIPGWYTSRFTTFRVFTLKKGRWHHLIPGIYCSRFDFEEDLFYSKMVEQGDSTFVWIREWERTDLLEERYVRKKRKIQLKPVWSGKSQLSWTN